MPGYQIIDTFPTFLDYWEEARAEALDTQVDLWLTRYAAQWPELAEKQRQGYVDDGLVWRVVLKERVFPFLPERLPVMIRARDELAECSASVYHRAQHALGLDFDVVFVIQALGYGGWATTYQGKRACLLGLDTIAELGWTATPVLKGLIARELGHLFHLERRARRGITAGEGSLWNAYMEGLAQRCEHLIMGQDTWHMQHGQEEWLAWCGEHKLWLAQEFLKTAKGGEPVNKLFGSWPEYHVCGYHQCGYFLGHEVIREWQEHAELEDIAVIATQEVDDRVRETLEDMASSDRRWE